MLAQADGLLRSGEKSGPVGTAVCTTAREILEDYAGGMRDGLKSKPGSQAARVLTS